MVRNQNRSANFLLHDKALFHLALFPGKGIRQRRVKFSWGWSTRWPMLWPSSSARPWWGRWVLCPRLVRQPWLCASTSPPRLSLSPEGRFKKLVYNCKIWIICMSPVLQYFILRKQWVLISKTNSEQEHPFHNIRSPSWLAERSKLSSHFPPTQVR